MADRGLTPTAVIVTRGDVDLQPILQPIPHHWPLFVWDNSRRENLRVYGRYAALNEIDTEYVYVQDDDALCPATELLEAWTPEDGNRILTNRAGSETAWVGWGAIFRTDLPRSALDRYIDAYGMSDDVLWWADVIVTTLTPLRIVELGVTHQPYHADPHRMFVQPAHYAEQRRVREKAEALK